MEKLGKGIFGKGFNLKAEVTNGDCPLCEAKTVFVSIYQNVYRCMSCGADLQQHVNGKISYLPVIATPSDKDIMPFVKEWKDG